MDMSVNLNSALDTTRSATGAQAAKAVPAQDGTTQSASGSSAKPDRTEVEKAVKDMQQFVDSNQRNLNFSIDDSTGDVVVKVIATQSGEVIRQLPSEAALKLAQSMQDPKNMLFHEQV